MSKIKTCVLLLVVLGYSATASAGWTVEEPGDMETNVGTGEFDAYGDWNSGGSTTAYVQLQEFEGGNWSNVSGYLETINSGDRWDYVFGGQSAGTYRILLYDDQMALQATGGSFVVDDE